MQREAIVDGRNSMRSSEAMAINLKYLLRSTLWPLVRNSFISLRCFKNTLIVNAKRRVRRTTINDWGELLTANENLNGAAE